MIFLLLYLWRDFQMERVRQRSRKISNFEKNRSSWSCWNVLVDVFVAIGGPMISYSNLERLIQRKNTYKESSYQKLDENNEGTRRSTH